MTILNDLKTISRTLTEAPTMSFIAGGAIRDIDFGVVPKDIDIFCMYQRDDEIDPMLQFMSNHMEYWGREGEGNEYEGNVNDIDSVHNYRFGPNPMIHGQDFDHWVQDNRTKVQLVFMKHNEALDPIKQTLDSFDLGICQAALYYDGEAEKFKTLRTDLYKENKRNNLVTLTPSAKMIPQGERTDKTRRRASRIAGKLGMARNIVFEYERVLHQAVWQNYQNRAERNQFNQLNRIVWNNGVAF